MKTRLPNISYCLFAIGLLCAKDIKAQTNAYNDGLDITVLAGQEVYMDDMGFTNQTNGISGSLDNDGDIYIDGDWNNNAIAGVVAVNLDATGTINFTGTTAQALGGTRTSTFENLVINNTSPTGVTLDEIATVNTSLTLTDGIVFTDATNLLVVVDAATSTLGSIASHVDGPMKKIGNDNNFTFPLGDNGVWARLQMRAMNLFDNTTEMKAEYIRSPSLNPTNLEPTINNVSAIEYWELERVFDPGNNAGLQVRLHWENEITSGITNVGDLTVARYSSSTNLWEDRNGVGTDNGLDGYITSTAVISDFTDFTLGSLTGINPLPIELISFHADLVDQQVNLMWETASEVNNDYFVIERSSDATNYEDVTQLKGAGNSSTTLNYETIDSHPLSGLSYYRLKQVDFDGSYSYSQIRPIYNNAELASDLSLFPNPSSGSLMLNFDTDKGQYITIVNTVGIRVKTITIDESQGVNSQQIDVTDLAPGYYNLNLLDNNSDVIQHARFVLTK